MLRRQNGQARPLENHSSKFFRPTKSDKAILPPPALGRWKSGAFSPMVGDECVACSMAPMMPNMKCEGCGFDAPADFSFCPKCGRKLGAATGAIASGPPATPPAAPASEADRRPATILFADLTGFTALSERLDPEDVRALQTDLFDEMRAVLLREDALLEKFVGDAVMAVVWRARRTEDDPQRCGPRCTTGWRRCLSVGITDCSNR
jgi:hypothetical protein